MDHIRPIADERGRLLALKDEDRDVGLILDLVAQVRRWANFAERALSAP
jgi:hypothetical protein